MALSDSSLKLLDIIVKGGFAALLTAALTWYGYRQQTQSEKHTSRQEFAQAIIDMTSKEKDLDVQTAEDMFKSLADSYFQGSGKSPDADAVHRRLLLLNLVALNFQDVPVQFRPLFEDLDKQITRAEDRATLRGIALEVASRQATRLTLNGLWNSGEQTVAVGHAVPIPGLQASVTITQVMPDSVWARIDSPMLPGSDGSAPGGHVGPFEVGYFALPLTDNTKLQEYRLAVMLLQGGAQQAKIRIIAFDSELAPDRFDLKELGMQLTRKDHSAL
jgi:hypothetical protein